MPNRKDLQFGSTHPVVQEVLRSIEQESAYLGRPIDLNLRADVRLLYEDLESVLDVFPYSTWSGETILGPPLGCLLDLAPGARLDAVGKCHGLTVALQALEKLRPRSACFLVYLVNRLKKLLLQMRRELDGLVVLGS
jgi:hypothetical protein